MKIQIGLLIVLIYASMLAAPMAGIETADAFPKGVLIERVLCRQTPSEPYALYLPSNYSPEKSWPVLWTFEPGGRVLMSMQLFQEIAQAYHYILICPNNVKNGPMQPVVASMTAVWRDLSERFNLNKNRIYAAGFSGGARMAALFPLITGQALQGILAVGAGLGNGMNPEQLNSTLYFGIAGFGDFNYRELHTLEKDFSPRATPYRFIYYDAPHQWPPQSLCQRAIEWFELQAMKADPGMASTAQISTLFEKERLACQAREDAGEPFFAAKEFADLERDYRGLILPAMSESLRQKLDQLQGSKAYKRFSKEEDARLLREINTITKAGQIFSQLKQTPNPDMSNDRIIANLELNRIHKEASQSDASYDAGLATRLLDTIATQANIELAAFLEQKDLYHAEIFAEIVYRARKGSAQYANALYNSACIYALQNKTKPALRTLQEAVENGFSNISLLMEDPDLQSLRDTLEFKSMVLGIKK